VPTRECKKSENTLTHYDTIDECDVQTDRQTDRQTLHDNRGHANA